MVSFQCDACQDVVKKPKLDNHFYRCHASFTCVDCSTTFNNGQWKGHTQCISEAEKYQKGLYKGKKTNGSNGPRGGSSAKSQTAPVKVPESSRDQPRPLSQNEAVSGADSMDVDASGIAEEKQAELSVKDGQTDAKSKKRKRQSEALDKALESTAPMVSEVGFEGKKKKKKQKGEVVDESAAKAGEVVTSESAATLGKALEASPEVLVSQVVKEKEEKKKRKEKKSKKEKSAERIEINANGAVTATEGNTSLSSPVEQDGSNVSEKKKKNREGKDREPKGTEDAEVKASEPVDSSAVESAEGKKKKRKDGSKKEKKLKGDVLVEGDTDENTKLSTTADEKSKAIMGDLDVHEVPANEGKKEKKKEKKRKEKKKAETVTL